MYERFTDGARAAIQRAQEEARQLKHTHVGTEHLLLGLVADEGPAGQAFSTLNVTLDGAREQVRTEVPPGETTPGELKFSPRAKGTLDGAPRQARGLKDDYVGTDHLLLALLIERDSRTANVLTLLGCPPDLLRTTVLQGRKAQPVAPPTPGLAPALAAAAREVAAERGAGTPEAGDLMLALTSRSPMLGRALAELGVTPDALRAAVQRARQPPAS